MRKALLLGLIALIGVLAVSTVALADRGPGKGDGNGSSFSTRLNGWEEDPSQVTTGHGSFKLDTSSMPWRFTLRYEDMEGPVFMAHIHIGSRHESGGISAWLCGATAVGTPSEKVCPPGQTAEGVVVGTIEQADITGPAGQGVEPGNFADLLRALRRGETYTNVHTTGRATGGEIRGQNRRGGGHGKGRGK
jgi:CHRD domain-containing protein